MSNGQNNSAWDFPDVSLYSGVELNDFTADAIKVQTTGRIQELENQLAEKEEQIKQLTAQLEQQEQGYQQRLKELNQALNNFQASLPAINNNLSELMLDSVKTMVTKTIKTEMTIQPDILINLIQQLADDIKTKGLIKAEVSSADFEIIKHSLLPENIEIIANPQLNPGDIVLNCDQGYFLQRLNDRVDQVLGSSHDRS